ncbi:restriction endonuclease subunit S [Gardnerella pickettii]|uniref:restriction endonuclease subunit S n=1 Tax=Gardnerella pickettii TaxID=2914924 RepID=UPI000763F404|nr:restriction endonuclease subunit S [Gardnerella pickettii]KXA16036.1 type I restriction modification DNA specificity domain protein [Gardnerella pickettii]MDF2278539.1 restriction endonuclease subunit S [Gardnerella pickettii]
MTSKLEDLIAELCPNGVEYKKIGDIADVKTGKSNGNEAEEDGLYPFFVRSENIKRKNDWEYDEEAIIIPGEGGIGDIYHYIKGKYALHQRVYRVHFEEPIVNTRFAYYYFKSNFKRFIIRKAVSATVTSIRKPMIEDFEIPVPPLDVQAEIVRILDTFTELTADLTAELTGRKKQYEYYRYTLLTFNDNNPLYSLIQRYCPNGVEYKKIGDIADYEQPTKYIVKSTRYDDSFTTPVLTAGQSFILGYTDELDNIYLASKDNPVIIFDDFTGAIQWVDFPFKVKSSAMKMITAKPNVLIRYLYHWMALLGFSSSEHKRLWISTYSNFEIPVPPLEVQRQIVQILDRFDALCNDLTQGLPAEIEARRKQYEYYRDQLLTFKRA